MGILMDGVMGCRTYDGLMQVFCRLYTGVMMVLCGFGFPEPPPCPPSHHVKAKPVLMLLIERDVGKIYVIPTWDVF